MLKIGGDATLAQNLLTMLEDAASMGPLQPGLRSGDAVRLGKGRSSAALHRCLRTMIKDPVRHAQATVTGGSAILFGTFTEWQNVNVVNASRINAGAPGMGVAIAFHEIWENYVSRDGASKRGPYGPAHAQALAVEQEIASELRGEDGGRVAAAQVGAGAGLGWVLDYEEYFLVLTARPEHDWGTGRFDAAIRDREFVGDHTIGGLTAGQRAGPDRLTDVVAALQEHPLATAKVTGQRTAAEAPVLAGQRATAVRSAIAIALNPDQSEYGDQQGTITLGRDEHSPGTTLGALRVWAGPEQVVGDQPGATVDISEPEQPD